MLVSFLKRITKHMNSLTIEKDGLKYLTRYFVFGADRRFGNIFIHHFHRSDMDVGAGGYGLLHSHPWPWSFSIVLTAGYSEERRMPDGTVKRKLVKPWTINFLTKKDFHRVDLVNGEAWTIFFTGPRSKNLDWYFWDRMTNETIFWKNIVGAVE